MIGIVQMQKGEPMDLIERQVAIRKLKRMAIQANIFKLTGSAETIINCCIDVIERQIPSAQPEREKGEWTKDCACEICGFKPWYERDIHTLSFCPNCGADMMEDQDG